MTALIKILYRMFKLILVAQEFLCNKSFKGMTRIGHSKFPEYDMYHTQEEGTILFRCHGGPDGWFLDGIFHGDVVKALTTYLGKEGINALEVTKIFVCCCYPAAHKDWEGTVDMPCLPTGEFNPFGSIKLPVEVEFIGDRNVPVFSITKELKRVYSCNVVESGWRYDIIQALDKPKAWLASKLKSLLDSRLAR